MTELKPCPFCGGKAEIERTTRSMVIPEFRIFCGVCGAMMKNWNNPYWRVDYFDTEEDAIKAWNRRKDGFKRGDI